MNTTVAKIINYIGKTNCNVKGQTKRLVKGVNPITDSNPTDLTFCNTYDSKAVKTILASKSSVIICHEKLSKKLSSGSKTLIFVSNPRLYFLRCLKKYFSSSSFSGIDKKAVIKSKTIHVSSRIGAFVYVGNNVTIGKNCIIEPGVVIHDNTKISDNVKIHAGAVIGADGYGFEKDESDNWEKFPQIGGVKILNNVEIGANSCIMKGTLTYTTIGIGSKIGHLVNIGHNVKVGSNCIVLPQSVVAGGTTLGNNVFVSMGSIIRDSLEIKDNVTIGMGSVVTKNIPKGQTVLGIPAKSIRRQNKGKKHK